MKTFLWKIPACIQTQLHHSLSLSIFSYSPCVTGSDCSVGNISKRFQYVFLWQLGHSTHPLYFYNPALEAVFSLWNPQPPPSFPSLPPSIPFLLLNTSPSQPMESPTTVAERQWSFCKYHWYICVLVSVCGSVRQFVCVCVNHSHTTLQRLINLLKLVHITAVSSACCYTAATSWRGPVQQNAADKIKWKDGLWPVESPKTTRVILHVVKLEAESGRWPNY